MLADEDQHADQYQSLRPLFCELADPRVPQQRRSRVRTTLTTAHLPVADHIALRYRNHGQPLEDLRQVARLGLVHAVDRFDPGRGTDFLSFAVPTITCEVRRYFRDATWAVRVPRRLKELRTTVIAAAATLSQELARAPRPREIADALGIPIEDVYDGLQANYAYQAEPLDPFTDGDSPELERAAHLGVVDTGLELAEGRAALYPALANLPDRERAIVIMRFFEDLTQTQIAQRIGMSQMHVSRLLAQSLAALRIEMSAE